MKVIIYIFVLVLISINVVAFLDPVAKNIEPLPDEEVEILFKRIDNKEKIPLMTLHQALKSSQITLRAYAARELGNYGNETSIPYLIDALFDDSIHVGANYIDPGMATTRYWANKSLEKLTGKDFGYIWNSTKEKRIDAVTRWQEWYFRKYRNPTETHNKANQHEQK